MIGTLYVVATPIGNLKDITLRAVEILQETDLVIAENRERALALLSHLQIRKPIVTINAYNEARKARSIATQVLHGKQCALISGAGTPCMSDPGNSVVQACQEMGIEVRAVPGASAIVAALSVSGLSPDRFLFYGFLPQKRGKRRKVLTELLTQPFPVVFFESPRRLVDTIRDISEIAEGREVVLAKEMTKMYEEIQRGRADEILSRIPEEVKGEYTIIVGGRNSGKDKTKGRGQEGR